MKNNDKLPPIIDDLVDQLEPVTPLPATPYRLASWIIPGLFIVLGGSYFLGWEKMLEHRLERWGFWVEQGLLLFTSLAAAHGAVLSSVPGLESKKFKSWATFGAIAWALFLLFQATLFLSQPGRGPAEIHATHFCPTVLLVMCIPLGVWLGFILKKGSVLNEANSAFLTVLSASMMATFGLQLSCFVGSPFHLLLFHMTPAFIVTGLGIFIARRLLRWKG